MKICKCCGVEKPHDQYETYRNKYTRKECKQCRSVYAASNRYKLTREEVLAIKNKENCEICEVSLEWSDRYIDHNHETGAVRGMLCPRCNSVLSTVENNIHLIDKMKLYLNHYEDKN